MELIDNFNQKNWKAGSPKDQKGYRHFRVGSRVCVSPGIFKYNLVDSEGNPQVVEMKGCKGKQDPLKVIANVEVRLSEDEKQILAIIVEDDCLVYTG